MCEREEVGIMVTVYNPCVKGRKLVSWLLYKLVCGREGVWYHGYCINSCVEGRKLVSWLLYTTRV